ncbi:hypothetical protein LZC95_04710 [Pendulispora brunnea]|uniref:Uncharacterized protein n=1 Tax=Pendulispora brunnea TaxID=2905690 RepID=A0ABZ2KBU4_9BACT
MAIFLLTPVLAAMAASCDSDPSAADGPIHGPDGSADGSVDAGTQDVEPPDSGPRCSNDEPEPQGIRPLRSIDDVKAALRSSPPFPFPGGWGPCRGAGICPDGMPALSFDESVTHASCGKNTHSGFRASYTFPITLSEMDAGRYAIQLQFDAGAVVYEVQALGSVRYSGFFLAAESSSSSPTIYAPLPALL